MPRGRNAQGFTLLELLVVLAILALAAGMAAPSMARWIERNQARAWRSELQAYLASRPLEAYRKGQSLQIDVARLRGELAGLPPELELVLESPLRYAENGSTAGGRLVLRLPARGDELWIIAPVTGNVGRPTP